MNCELWNKGKFRVCPISRVKGIQTEPFDLIVEKVPIIEGLGIEYRINDSYIVIAFVKPNKEGLCSYESIGTRIEDYCKTWKDILIFREALNFAINKITNLWKEINE